MKTLKPYPPPSGVDIHFLTKYAVKWGYIRRIRIDYSLPDHVIKVCKKSILPIESLCKGSDEATCTVIIENKIVYNHRIGCVVDAIFEDHKSTNTTNFFLNNALYIPQFEMINKVYKDNNGGDIPQDIVPRISINVTIDDSPIQYIIYKYDGKYYLLDKSPLNGPKVKELPESAIKSFMLPLEE